MKMQMKINHIEIIEDLEVVWSLINKKKNAQAKQAVQSMIERLKEDEDNDL